MDVIRCETDTAATEPTEWTQRRQLVQEIMNHVTALLDCGSGAPGSSSLRDILSATGVTLDTIRARVATQAFADGAPGAFWPAMRRVLDRCAPQLGELVCAVLEWDLTYKAFWESDVRELRALQAERVRE